MRGGVAVGAPFRLSIPSTTAALVLPLDVPRLWTVLLHLLGAVTLELSVRLASMALVGRGRHHRGPPAQDHEPRRVARLLVHVKGVDRILEVNGRELFTVVHLTDELKLWGLRQAREHDV